jgi:phenylpropionate dioxygenase-like ring-hydroxylating dioxygenase large terminal subunit
MMNARTFREVQRPLEEASHAPGSLYASADVHQLEIEKLFRRDWLLVGRTEELPDPGDWPDGPHRSRTVIYHLFPEAFFDRPGFGETLKVYRDYQLQVLEEDRSMIESMQLAMSSPAYRPGRMSVLEKPLHHYLNGYVDRLFGDERGGA